MTIRPVTTDDAIDICVIYNHYIEETIISFEEHDLSIAEMTRRIESITATYPWLALEDDERILGYAYAGPWKPRTAYRYTVESTIYLAPGAEGKGLGTTLYSALLEELAARGIRQVLAGIALPNPASVALHEKCGFTLTGVMPRVGYKFGQWIDVGYWQRELGG